MIPAQLDVTDRAVRVVDLQSTPIQPEDVAEQVIVRILAQHPAIEPGDARDAIATAVDEGRLVENEAGDRYSLAEGEGDIAVPGP